MEERELVIIGSGPAGMTAAVYGRRAGLDTLVLEKGQPGGQILITSEIENWPGTQETSGSALAKTFADHAASLNAETRKVLVKGITPGEKRHVIHTASGDIQAKAIVIATGASFRHVGCPGESKLIGAGVSYCAVCDGAMFEDEVIAVIGGGNTAVEEAEYLTRFAKKVYIVHRRNEFRADRLVAERALANPKIVPVWDTIPVSIDGDELVESLTVKNVKTEEISKLEVAGVFVFVGTSPNLGFLEESQLERVAGGWIKADSHLSTSVPGIFVAGDVRDTPLRQVVTAAGDGALAAMSAYHWITALKG